MNALPISNGIEKPLILSWRVVYGKVIGEARSLAYCLETQAKACGYFVEEGMRLLSFAGVYPRGNEGLRTGSTLGLAMTLLRKSSYTKASVGSKSFEVST